MLDRSQAWDEEKAVNYLDGKAGGDDKNTILVSAIKGWGLTKLKERLAGILREEKAGNAEDTLNSVIARRP
jgi:hypothetical protein